ncbi:Hypp7564 [Branchiostoma lanceolatum]|uniref:Hypp7564 protein n=1 Tax=Branchiostoma lanceolatum TaxID=7740 RepID=A0A8J9Z268_BRALA|nr:Hypp7564 [Branchiostoma lanceolatum]
MPRAGGEPLLKHVKDPTRHHTVDKKMAAKLLMIAVACAVWCAVAGRVTQESRLITETVWDHGQRVTRQYCNWEGTQRLKGGHWKTIDCEECRCSSSGLRCEIAESYVPAGCIRIYDENCYERIVQSDDPDRSCSSYGK